VPRALVIGSSTGIGLAIAARLARDGWDVVGVARRDAGFTHARYTHLIGDVRDPDIGALLVEAAGDQLDLCVYAAGVGRFLDLDAFAGEADLLDINLLGAIRAIEAIVPLMIAAGRGHVIGLSSQADRLISGDTPGYNASKAGLSHYLESLALACRRRGVAITNLRLGFVDTTMSEGGPRPFLRTTEQVAALVVRCVKRRPIRVTYPWRMAALVWLIGLPSRLRVWLG
jgi:NAD(P)-dependent dehydrogenase (short-subunit alcohol dehydrogenase family)